MKRRGERGDRCNARRGRDRDREDVVDQERGGRDQAGHSAKVVARDDVAAAAVRIRLDHLQLGEDNNRKHPDDRECDRHGEREGRDTGEGEDPHRLLGRIRGRRNVVRREDGVAGRDREALGTLGLGRKRPPKKLVPDASQDSTRLTGRENSGVGRYVVPLRATEVAARRNDPHVAIAWPSTLLWDELFEPGKVPALALRVHPNERRAKSLNSVSTNAAAPSTTSQSPLKLFGAEAVTHAGLGHQVGRILRIAFDLAPQPSDIDV